MVVIFLIIEQELTDKLNAPVVFSHNDLLSGNLMLNEDEGLLSLFFNIFFFPTWLSIRVLMHGHGQWIFSLLFLYKLFQV